MNFKVISVLFICTFLATNLVAETKSPTLTRATNEELATAVGYYARSRSLLLAALREFDKGLSVANPDQLVDVKELRHTILDQAEALQKILSPQPRTTKYGVKFEADSRLLTDVVD